MMFSARVRSEGPVGVSRARREDGIAGGRWGLVLERVDEGVC